MLLRSAAAVRARVRMHTHASMCHSCVVLGGTALPLVRRRFITTTTRPTLTPKKSRRPPFVCARRWRQTDDDDAFVLVVLLWWPSLAPLKRCVCLAPFRLFGPLFSWFAFGASLLPLSQKKRVGVFGVSLLSHTIACWRRRAALAPPPKKTNNT